MDQLRHRAWALFGCTGKYHRARSTAVGGYRGVSVIGLAFLLAQPAPACPPTWVQRVPNVNGPIDALTVLSDGSLIATGGFTMAGSVAAHQIARYQPATKTWTALAASGVAASPVNGILALLPLGGGDFVVGSAFDNITNPASNAIASYDPAQGWSILGTGIHDHDNAVYALAALPGGDLIVGGSFSAAGGVAANNIARYSPSTQEWTPLGSGVNGHVYSLLTLPNGDVVVGGGFNSADTVAADSLARYSPSTGAWSSLGSDLSGGFVYALATVSNGDLIAGGDFLINGQTIRGIARYNAILNTWSALGAGIGGSVKALATLPSGDLVVGGGFWVNGQSSVGGIAIFDPITNSWSGVGSGINGYVNALAVLSNGEVAVGGSFSGLNTGPADFAIWTTVPSCPGDFNCSGKVTAQDIFDFLAAWFDGTYPAADFNGDGHITVLDIYDFLAAWFTPCNS